MIGAVVFASLLLAQEPAVRKVRIDARDQPARDVLADVARQAGAELSVVAPADAALTLQLAEAWPLEAIDAVCRRAGTFRCLTVPNDTDDRYVSLQIVPGRFVECPVWYGGRYRVRVRKLLFWQATDFRETRNGCRIALSCDWLTGTDAGRCLRLDLTEVQDDRKRSLLEQRAPKTAPGCGTCDQCIACRSFELPHPPHGAAELTLKGRVAMRFNAERKVLRIDLTARERAPVELHGLTMSVTRHEPRDGMHWVTLETTGAFKPPDAEERRRNGDTDTRPFAKPDVYLVTAGGRRVRAQAEGRERDSPNVRFATPEEAKAIEIECVVRYRYEQVAFEIRNVRIDE